MTVDPIILPDDPREGAVPMCPPNLKRIVLEENQAGHEPRPFPRGFFPRAIERIVAEAADSKRAPFELAALPALAVICASLGKTFTIDVQGYIGAPRLWFGIVAPPGSAKTPVSMELTKPIELIHERDLEQYRELKAEWESRLASRGDKKAPREKLSNAPVFSAAYSCDTTSEKLLEDLSRSERGHLYLLNELSLMLAVTKGGAKKGEAGASRFLMAWDGASIRVSRKGQDESFVKDPFLAVYASTPRSVLSDLGLSNNDGAAARFLWAAPKIVPTGLGRAADPEAARDWRRVVERARGLPAYHASLTGPMVKAVDDFSMDCGETRDELERRGRGLLSGVFGKGLAQYIRLLSLCHGLDVLAHQLFDGPTPRIESAAERCFDAMGFFLEHSMNVLGPLSPASASIPKSDAQVADRLRDAARSGPEEDSASGWTRRLEALGIELKGPRALGHAMRRLQLAGIPDLDISKGRGAMAKTWAVRVNGAVNGHRHHNGTTPSPTEN